jgi:hypothetical protein
MQTHGFAGPHGIVAGVDAPQLDGSATPDPEQAGPATVVAGMQQIPDVGSQASEMACKGR